MCIVMASEDKIPFIKTSLFDFVSAHVPNADLDAVDDVIVSYVFAAIDAIATTPDDFYAHVNELIEIISAYVTDFSKIERDDVYIWLMNIMETLTEEKQKPYMDEAAKPEEKKDIFSFQIPKEHESKGSSSASSRSNSTSEDDLKFPSKNDFETSEARTEVILQEEDLNPTLTKFLIEMFPDSSPIELKHCVSIAVGDVERALATILHRQDHGLALSSGSLPARTNKPAPQDSASIKTRIIERYSYVDRDSETKEHKPIAPKHAPKKLVRYRDNKIVSLKGERYTEVSKGEEEGVKKSNKKHHP